MFLTMMRSKIHQARVTCCDLHYEGSISIDDALLEASGILPGEQVHVWNMSNAARIITYAIRADAGSREIGVNGAAARHFQLGDKVIITSFAQMSEEEARAFKPVVLLMGEDNQISSIKE